MLQFQRKLLPENVDIYQHFQVIVFFDDDFEA